MALGSQAKADDVAGIAIGPAAWSAGNTSLALGRQTAATADFAQAIGNVAAATGKGSLAMGHSATAEGYRAIAIGSADIENAGSTGDQDGVIYQTALRTHSTGRDSIALGGGALATENDALAIGAFSASSGEKSVAIGTGANAQGKESVSIGQGSVTTLEGAVAVGQNARVETANSAAIGRNSVATAPSGLGYLTNSPVPSGVVSIGTIGDERRLQNVSAGSADTDAVNVSQLKVVNETANKGWDLTANGEAIGENIAPGETADFTQGKNIAITRTGNSIAVATADDVDFSNVNVTNRLDVAGDTNIGGNTTINGGTTVKGDTYLGDNFKVVNNEAFYDGAITENTHIVNKEYVDGGIGDLADTPITFAGDTGATDRKLGDELNIVTSNANLSTEVTDDKTLVIAMSDDLDVNSVTTNSLDVTNNATIGGTLNVTGQTTLTGGLDMAGNTITNVAPGVNGTDAVNVDQLTDVSDVANKGWDLTANGEATGENIAPGETADFSEGKNIAITRTSNSIEVATADDVEFTNVEVTENLNVAGDTNIAGDTIIGGSTTINENLTVEGTTQLGDNFFVNNEGNVTYDGNITENNHITNKQYVDNSVTELGDTPLTFAGDSGTPFERKLGETTNVIGGNTGTLTDGNIGVVADGTDTLQVKLAENVDLGTNGSVVMGDTTVNNNGLTIAGGPSITNTGIDAGNTTITNVAPGVNGTDAVNVDQLTDVSDVANKGWDLTANGEATGENIAPGETADFSEGKNIAIIRTGNSIEVATADDAEFTNVEVTENLNVAGDTNIAGDTIIGGSTTINENLTVEGTTQLGDNFVVNNDGNVTYTGDITEGDHITNKTYVDGLGDDLVAEGLNFAGNDGAVIHKDLGEQLNIVGGMTDLTADAASAENLRTVQNADGDLEVQLSKNLTNLESVESTTVNVTEELTVANNTTINEGGITTNNVDITENLTVAGETKLGDHFVVNNEGNVTYTGDITEGDHITNKTYVDGLGDDLVAEGLNFAGNDGEVIHKDLGEQLDIVGGMTDLDEDAASAENLRTVQNADGALEIQLSKNLTNLESVESTTVNVTEELTVANNTTINEGGITTNNVDITENLTVAGETKLGDHFVVNNEGNVTYTGDITEGDHITNKTYVDGLGDDLIAEGLNFAGNDGEVIHKDLGEQLDIVGGMTDLDEDAASAENLRTVQNADGALEIQLSKNLTNLESVESTTVNVTEELTVANNTTINEGGITTNNVDITENLTVAGETKLGDHFVVNNEGNVTYTGDITEGDHITNKTYVDGLGDDLIAEGLNFAGNDGEVIHKDLGEQLDIVGGMTDLDEDAASAENLRTVQNADGALEIQLSKNLTNLESVESTTVNVTEELTVANNTTINEGGITTNNVDITENLTVAGETKLGDNFVVNNEGNVTYTGDITEGDHITNKTYVDGLGDDLIAEGLNFAGNDGEVIHKDLGEQLDIVGGMTDLDEDAASAENLRTVQNADGALEIQLSKNLTNLESVESTTVNVTEELTVANNTTINEGGITTNNVDITENLTVAGETKLGDNFVVNNEGNVTYTGDITEGDHITNKTYVDGLGDDLIAEGLNFAGNDGEVIHKDLGEQLDIVGGMTDLDEDAASAENLRTVQNADGALEIQLSKNLTNLESVESTTVNVTEELTVANNTTINEGGITTNNVDITENLTVAGETKLGDNFVVNNEGNVTYTGDITEGDHITNKTYVDNSVTELGDTPLTFGANEGEDTERRLGDRLDIVGEADDEGHSNIITKVTDEETLELALNTDLNVDNSITVGETFIDGDSITTNNMTVNENLYVDGSTTINENLTVEGDTHLGDHFSIVNNEAYYDGPITEGDHITNKTYVDNSVTELGDTPLTFGANEGEDTERRLGDRLDIVGEADDEGHSNIITKVTDEETLELALNADLNVDNSITVGETFIDGDSITTNNMTVNENLTVEGDTHLNENLYVDGSTTINENLTVEGDTHLGDHFSIVNNEAYYDGPITEGDHITNKSYVDNSVSEVADTPLTFGANEGEDTERRLGDRLDIVGEADDEGHSNIITKVTDEETLELALNADLNVDNSITVGETFIDGDSITTNNMTVNENLTVAGETRLGDNFFVNNEGNVTYTGDITEGDHITNKNYVDNSVTELGDTPLTFGANEGEDTERRLGDRLDIVGEADDEGHRNIITKVTDEETLELALNADLNIDNSITVGETFIDGDSITTNNMTVNENLTVVGETRLGDNFVVNNEGNVTYTGEITEGDHITNKSYVDNSVSEVADTPLTFGANEGEDTERRLGDRLDIVGEANEEGNSNIITKLTDDETLELALNADLEIGNSITVGEGGPTISGDGIDMGDNKIINVTDGDVSADSKDAINGSQLYQLESIVTNVTGDVSNEYVTNNGRGIRYVRTNDSGLAVSDAFAQGEGSTAVGYEAVASADRALAMGYDAIASHQGSVALGEGARTAEAVSTASVEIAGQTYQFAGVSPVATVSVGSVGAERTVTNVAAGRISAESTDAINGSQLYATNQAVGELDNRVTNVEGDITNITNDLADLDDRAVKYDRNDDGSVDYGTITLEGDGGTKITNVAPGDIAQNSSDAVNGSQLWDVQNQITNIEQGGSKYFRANSDGPAADPQGTDSIAMGPGSVAAGDRSVASGAGAQAKTEGSVALGADSVADREGMNGERERFSNESVASTQGAVSVGSEGNERQITNVAGGTQDTDAVNVRQLDAVQRGAVNYDRDEDGNVDYSTITLKGAEGTTITNVAPGVNETDAVNVGQMNELGRRFENEIVNVHDRIDSVERNANAGSASAIAASTVPQAWMPGKSMIGVGAGTYGGESAVSVGVSRLSDNGRWVIQGKVTGDSQSNFGAGIGAGWHW
ncbi:YadA-like family protein [Vreelandella alkaliphila]